jgi:dTDP-4-dehydrorhamnose 3,5-epimerase
MMEITRAAIPDVLIIRPAKRVDERGFFSETYEAGALRRVGIDIDWVQENHVCSAERGVVRGLHFQAPPAAQAKLIRVVRGAIYDVAVDLRKTSPSYGRHVALELSAENWLQLLAPVGFAHGYCALRAGVEVVYKVSAEHAAEHEGGLNWDDPALGIVWPVAAQEARVSPRDRSWPAFSEFNSPF